MEPWRASGHHPSSVRGAAIACSLPVSPRLQKASLGFSGLQSRGSPRAEVAVIAQTPSQCIKQRLAQSLLLPSSGPVTVAVQTRDRKGTPPPGGKGTKPHPRGCPRPSRLLGHTYEQQSLSCGSGSWTFKVTGPSGFGSGETVFLASNGVSSPWARIQEGAGGSVGPLYRSSDPRMELPPSWAPHLPKARLASSSLGLGLSTHLGDHTVCAQWGMCTPRGQVRDDSPPPATAKGYSLWPLRSE